MADLMRQKSYKILMQEYRAMYNRIVSRCKTGLEFGQTKEDYKKVLEMITDKSQYDYNGLMNRETRNIVDTLEYLLDDSRKAE